MAEKGGEVLTGVGLYMVGCFIQLSNRDWTNRETGEVKKKYYVMLAIGNAGAVNVGVDVDEYAALAQKGLKPGATLLASVEAFGYKDKAYFRAVGPISVLDGGASGAADL